MRKKGRWWQRELEASQKAHKLVKYKSMYLLNNESRLLRSMVEQYDQDGLNFSREEVGEMGPGQLVGTLERLITQFRDSIWHLNPEPVPPGEKLPILNSKQFKEGTGGDFKFMDRKQKI